MNHTFDLAKKRLGLKGKLLPYRRANENTFKCYNNIPLTIKEIKEGTYNFNFSVANNGSIPEDVIAIGSGYFWDITLASFTTFLSSIPSNKLLTN
jgi:hypothetical protein